MKTPRQHGISLVVATLGRSDETRSLLESLIIQTVKPDEVIYVDQNDDDRLSPILKEYGDRLPIVHLRPEGIRGSSPARNFGWRQSNFDRVLFPDDDCWYPPDFLKSGITLLDDTGAGIVSGRVANEKGESINGRFAENATWVSRKNVWITMTEWTMFFRHEVLAQLGGFDPEMGVGLKYPAAEGVDLSLRAIKAGYRHYYNPGLYGHHAVFQDAEMPRTALYQKSRNYGYGMGHVLNIHDFPPGVALTFIGKSIARMGISAAKLDFRKAGFYWNAACGRAAGYLERPH